MINEEMLNYIKGQLDKGVPRIKIAEDLSSGGGWDKSSIEEAFSSLELNSSLNSSVVKEGSLVNKHWKKNIPRSNKSSMIISLILFLGLDLFIVISEPSLLSFWFIMLAVMGVFFVFYYLENYRFAKKFEGSVSKLDFWIFLLVIIRNIIFILNFIPFIQILGLSVLSFAGIPYLIIYCILSYVRSTKVTLVA